MGQQPGLPGQNRTNRDKSGQNRTNPYEIRINSGQTPDKIRTKSDKSNYKTNHQRSVAASFSRSFLGAGKLLWLIVLHQSWYKTAQKQKNEPFVPICVPPQLQLHLYGGLILANITRKSSCSLSDHGERSREVREYGDVGQRVKIAGHVVGSGRQARRVPTIAAAAVGRAHRADLDPRRVAPGAGRVVAQADRAAAGDIGVRPLDGNRLPRGERARSGGGKRKVGALPGVIVMAEVRCER